MRHKVLSVLGAVISLFSIFFVFAAIGDLLNPEEADTELGVLMGLLIFFSGTTISGIYLFISGRRKNRIYQYEKRERQILKIIAEYEGQVTPEEIALGSKLSVSEAQEYLDAMCSNGAGELRITEGGRRVYHFFGFISKEEKKSAESVLEK